MKLKIYDLNYDVAAALSKCFANCPEVEIFNGSIFTGSADAIVSPANSFGFMDGGIDALFLREFGVSVQTNIQEAICQRFGGELLVGQALLVPVTISIASWVICAPTMRTPRVIVDPDAVRLSTRAALRLARNSGFSSVLMTGMGAGSGRVPPAICAYQMARGWLDVFDPKPFPESWQEAAR